HGRILAEAIQAARVIKQRGIAAGAYLAHDGGNGFFHLRIKRRIAMSQRDDGLRSLLAIEQFHYITTLFSGYSTIPVPPAALRRGITSRTTVSSRMVLTATHS